MPVFIGLNRLKKLQTTAVSLIVPSCVGLNLLGYLSFVEVFYVSSIGTVKTILFLINYFE